MKRWSLKAELIDDITEITLKRLLIKCYIKNIVNGFIVKLLIDTKI